MSGWLRFARARMCRLTVAEMLGEKPCGGL